MKLFTITAIAALLLLLGSCKKNATNTALVGTWEIRSAQNGMIPTINYSSGNDSILKFTSTNYLIYSKGQLIRSGTYTIVKDNSFNALVVPSGQFTRRIIFDGDTISFKQFFQITGKTLTIVSGSFISDSGSKTEYEQVTEM